VCPGASARRAVRHAARRRLFRLCHASGCLGMSRGSSSTTSPTPRVRVPWHVTRLIVCLGKSHGSSRGSLRGSSSTTLPTPRVWVSRHITRLVTRLVVNYFAYAACPGASLCREARRAARRQLLRRSHAHGCSVSPLDFSSVGCTGSRHAPGHFVSRLDYFLHDRRDFVLRLHWLYYSHAVRHDYLSRGNTSSTLSTPRAAATSSSGHIASTTHLD
jgi:hypothetical protein